VRKDCSSFHDALFPRAAARFSLDRLGGRSTRQRARYAPAPIANAKPVNSKQQLVRVASSGYLLLEVLLALAILSIVVVMVFQIIQTTLRATSDINFFQTQQRKVDGICELLRRNFVSMPATCLFQTRNHNGSTELIFRYAPFNFSWMKPGAEFGTIVIASRPQPDGRLALSVLEESGNALESYVDHGIERKSDWVSLISDLDQLTWRFYNSRTGKWSLDWPDTSTKPNLLEINIKLAGRNHMERGVFRWPIAQTGS
jgi:type II secretory pathway component PulJ